MFPVSGNIQAEEEQSLGREVSRFRCHLDRCYWKKMVPMTHKTALRTQHSALQFVKNAHLHF